VAAPALNLHLDFAARLGDLDLRADLDVTAGSVLAVLGPNGAGKTSLLQYVAGARAVDDGLISLGGDVLDRPPDLFVPPERRHLGVVPQDHLLFPHLDALGNVAFGLRSQGCSKGQAGERAHRWLERVGAAEYARHKPRSLSGGQAQRVALARALAAEPRALLLDEPLSALDVGARGDIRRDLRRHLTDYGGATLLVTHDPVDALLLADEVAVLERGRITQKGTLAEVTTRPRTRYVADLIGTNLLRGTADGFTVTVDLHTIVTTADPHQGPVCLTISPSALALHRHQPEGSPRNRWPARVGLVELLGDRVRAHLASPLDLVAEITPAAAAELGLAEGGEVWVSVKATEIAVYAA
jgi:molybdate transport system ATP-binding protein